MSFSRKSYSKESRSSSCYARSSSYHASGNNSYSSSYGSRSFLEDRPLSTRLIERDSSCPSLAWNWDFDDPFIFSRCRRRLRDDDDFFKWNFGLGRCIPICCRGWDDSSSRNVPIQLLPSPTNRRHHSYRKLDINKDLSSSFMKRPDENSMRRENRISSDDWPSKQDPPTRKRSSMTIFIQQPFVNQSEIPYYRQTPSTPTYPRSARLDYY